jgi:hypothetical protein
VSAAQFSLIVKTIVETPSADIIIYIAVAAKHEYILWIPLSSSQRHA